MVSADHNFWRERRAETDSNWGPSAYQPNALPPGQTGSHWTLPDPTACIFHCKEWGGGGGWQVLFREVIHNQNITTAHPTHVCTELFQTLCFVGKGHSHSFHCEEWGVTGSVQRRHSPWENHNCISTELYQTLSFADKGHSHSFHCKEWGGDRFCSER